MTDEGCCPEEENHLGLCYSKCSLLTNGTHPYRTATNTCCNSPETFFDCFDPNNTLQDFPGAWGFGVSKGGEPAKPACKPQQCRCPIMTSEGCCPDEENYFGLCYKKCSILTNGTHNARCWPNMCGIKGGGDCWKGDNLIGSFGEGFATDRDGEVAKLECYTEFVTTVKAKDMGLPSIICIAFAFFALAAQ